MNSLMKTFCRILAAAAVAAAAIGCGPKPSVAERHGWKLAVQSYTFHKFTFEEALEKTASLGVKYIEAFPGHRLGERWGDQVFGFGMDEATRREILDLTAEKGVKIVGSGVFVAADASQWEQEFAFARAMGLEYISAEPAMQDWDLVERLSKEYGVAVAVHNHPRPSTYWTPDSLLKAVSGPAGLPAETGRADPLPAFQGHRARDGGRRPARRRLGDGDAGRSRHAADPQGAGLPGVLRHRI